MPLGKRALDIFLCILGLPFLCFFTVVMAAVVRLASPGPVFFRQERVGYRGRRFMCYKFRTMKVNADTRSHQAYLDTLLTSKTGAPMAKLDGKGDSRLIAGGWLLRATGIDELPQIINVWRQEMSFVGPRPCLPYEYDRYEPWHRERFNAMPGLTGLWQVSGKNRTSFDEMIKLDIRYSQSQNFLLDLGIILLTPPALAIQIADIANSRLARAQLPARPRAGMRAREPVKESSPAG